MSTEHRMGRVVRLLVSAGAFTVTACAAVDGPVTIEPPRVTTVGKQPTPPPAVVQAKAELPADKPALPAIPPAADQGKPLPIDLPTALALSGSRPLDVRLAAERVRAAAAAFDRARVLWLPDLSVGVEYYRHDGQIQDIRGTVFTTSRSFLFLGAGPTVVLPVGDAVYAPLVARQVVRAREADARAVRNDVTLQAAEAYFAVQQARGEVAGALDALRRAGELVARADKLAPALTPTVEVNRAKAEAARRRQAVELAYERWQVASADLTRVLRLEPGTLVEPAEDPALTVELFDPASTPDDLLPVALTRRPELAADQAVIQAALARVRQERVRPLVPTVAVRGVGGQVPGLAGGYFGGGINDDLQHFGGRLSLDIQAAWTVQNLGFGNRAALREREAESREALLGLLRTQDRVTAEVVQAHARARRSAARLKAAADGLREAAETADKNVLGLGQTKRVGDQSVLVFRPQEAVAAVAALDQAYRDYYAAVGDVNRAQFQLGRAVGGPVPVPPAAVGGRADHPPPDLPAWVKPKQ